MKRFLISVALCLIAGLAFSQTVLYTTGITYVDGGAPTHDPGARGAKTVIDTSSWTEYVHLSGSTWMRKGYVIDTLSTCTAPSLAPTKWQSKFKVNACDSMYQYRSGSWRHLNPTGISSVAWGGITGTLSDQGDLQTAINGKQDSDSDLTAISGLSPSNDDIIQRKAGAWSNRTIAQFKSDLAITSSDIGLGNVENTALSTWPGSANVITVGTVTTGNWNATDIPITAGGTGASDAATARTNLGVDAAGTDNSTPVTLAGSLDYLTIAGQVITRNAVDLSTDVAGSLPQASVTNLVTDLGNKQPLDAELTALATTTSAANALPYFTGVGTAGTTTLTAAGRALIDDADNTAQRTTLGLGTLATQSGTFSGTSSGTNTGDQTISLTGDVTGTGTGSFSATIADNSVTNAKAANMAANTLKGNATGVSADPADLALGSITEDATPASGEFLVGYDASGNLRKFDIGNLPTGGGGEVNDGTNVATNGVGVYDGKSGISLQFRGIASTTAALTVTLDDTENDIDLDIDESQLAGIPQVAVTDLIADLGSKQPLDSELTALATTTSAADALPYFTGVGTAGTTTLTTFGRSLIDDANAATARTTLGVDAAGTDNSTPVTLAGTLDYITIAGQVITRNAIDLTTDVTGSLPQASVTNLVTDLGNKQALDAELTALAGLTSASDALPYFTGVGTAGTTTLTTFGRSLIDDVDAATARTTLGVDAAGTDNSTNVTLAGTLDYLTIAGQVITRNALDLTTDVTGALPYSNLANAGANSILGNATGAGAAPASLQTGDITEDATPASGEFLVGYDASGNLRKFDIGNLPTGGGGEVNDGTNVATNGVGVYDGKSGISLQFRGVASTTAALTVTLDDTENDIDLGIDESQLAGIPQASVTNLTTDLGNKQALDAELTALATTTSAADALPYFTGVGTAGTTTLTTFGRSLIDDADDVAARTTLGLGTLATQSGTFSGTSSGTNTGDQTITLTGDVTGTGTGSFSATIADNSVTNAKAANMAANTLKGNATGVSADPADLALGSITEDATPASGEFLVGFDGSGNLRKFDIGNLPTGGGGEVNDGTNVATNGVGVYDGKSGISLQFRGVASTTAALTVTLDDTENDIDLDIDESQLAGIPQASVTNLTTDLGNKQALDAELTALASTTSAADALPYFTGVGTAGTTTLTAYSRTLIDDADASTARTTLGVDAAGTDNSTNVSLAGSLDYLTIVGQVITRNAVDLATDVTGLLPQASVTNLTTDLGNKQALDAELTALASTTSAADALPYFTGVGTAGTTTLTTFGRSLIDDAAASNARTTLGVDAAGTDNSTPVTLAGSLDYITIVGQVITRNAIDLTTDVTGSLPDGNIGGVSWSKVSSTPTTLGGYGITDALSNSTSSTQNGYFNTVNLFDQVTPSHYLMLQANENLTASRTLNIVTGDVSRTLTFSGDATIAGTNTGDQTISLTGDVTGSGTGSFSATIADNSVTNAKAANMAANTLKGNATGGSADPSDLALGSITEDATPASGEFLVGFDGSGNLRKFDIGNLPTGGGGEVNDGTNVATDGVGVYDGKSGVSLQFRGVASTTAALTVTLDDTDNDIDLDIDESQLAGIPQAAVTNLTTDLGNKQALDAELTALATTTSAADALPYFTGVGTAGTTTLTSFGRSLIDDAAASNARTTLGVDAAGTDNSTNVSLAGALTYITLAGQVITRNAITLTTDVAGTLPGANGGTNNTFFQVSGPSGTLKTFTFPNASATVLTNSTAVTVAQGGTGRVTSTTSYGLIAAGTTATGAHQTLPAGLTTQILVGGGTGALPAWTTATGSGSPVRATSPTLVTPNLGTPSTLVLSNATGLPQSGVTNLTTDLGNKQPLDADLTAIAGLTSAADALPYFTGSGTASTTTLTSFGRSLIDDADNVAARTTLGLGTLATQSGTFSGTSSGTNTGDQTITLTGNVTGTGTGSFATTISAGVVTNAMLAGSIAVSKLATGTDGELITWDASGNATTVAVGTDGQGLTSNGAGAAPTFENKREVPNFNAQTGTSYTFALTDAISFVTLSNAGAITATVPPNSTTAFPVGTVIDFSAIGAGQVTIAPGAGVTINSADAKLKLRVQYSGASLIKTATNTWLLVGDITD